MRQAALPLLAAAACAAALAVSRRNRLTYQLAAGSMRGLRAIVTGGSPGGIGHEVALALARAGAESIVLTVRDPCVGEAACALVRSQTSSATKISWASLDLTSMASIRAFAAKYTEAHERVDLLICNAGAMLPTHALATGMGGVERTYATNFLGHFALVQALEPALAASRSERGERPRVVQVGSTLERTAPALIDAGGQLALDEALSPTGYSPFGAYAVSKCAQLAFALELHRRRSAELVSVAVSPGMVNTHLSRFMPPHKRALASLLKPLLLRSPATGAESVLYACGARSEDVEGVYVRDCSPHPPSAQASSALFADRVWRHAEALAARVADSPRD
jgi:NAD(P)-dependent dehydrogenase (short-subunit alcohol dehydrogenase family)